MIIVNEVFLSLQGEGSRAGTPSVFIRTAGCPLRCAWCDVPRASWTPRGERMTIDDIVTKCNDLSPVADVVITGGEPCIYTDIIDLVANINTASHCARHITIETAGIKWHPMFAAMPVLWSVSPKLENSIPDAPHDSIHQRNNTHEHLPKFADCARVQFKFVVTDPSDFDEIKTITDTCALPWPNVWLMPKGVSIESINQPWLIDLCKERNCRYCYRQHIALGIR